MVERRLLLDKTGVNGDGIMGDLNGRETLSEGLVREEARSGVA